MADTTRPRHPYPEGSNLYRGNQYSTETPVRVLVPRDAEGVRAPFGNMPYNPAKGVYLMIVPANGARFVQSTVIDPQHGNKVLGARVDEPFSDTPMQPMGATATSRRRIVQDKPGSMRFDPMVGYVVQQGVMPKPTPASQETLFIRFVRLEDPARPRDLMAERWPGMRQYVLIASQNRRSWKLYPVTPNQYMGEAAIPDEVIDYRTEGSDGDYPMTPAPEVDLTRGFALPPTWTELELLEDKKLRGVWNPDYSVGAFFGIPTAVFLNRIKEWNREVHEAMHTGQDAYIAKPVEYHSEWREGR